jgi:hypothetical protein
LIYYDGDVKKKPKPSKQVLLSPRRNYTPPNPIKRVKRSYSRSRKKQVLLFLCHHRIPKTLSYSKDREFASVELRTPIPDTPIPGTPIHEVYEIPGDTSEEEED